MSRSKDALDRAFSIYIRRRDCPEGSGRCISCGRAIAFSTCDAGHFIPRTHTATRWNEWNCAAQCRDCNRNLYGNLKAYRDALIRRYGPEVVEGLERLKNGEVHLTDADYRRLTEYYRRRTAVL